MEASRQSTVAIVGGGMLGLTLALRLSRAGHAVTVFEAAPSFGGLASAWSLGSWRWDRHYHVTLRSDLHLRGLLAELDLEREMRWQRVGTGIFIDDHLYPMSHLRDLLRFPPLNLWQKFRLGLTGLRASTQKDWKALEKLTALEWLTRWSGKRVVEKIWLPLLHSKLGGNAQRVSATFIWATIARLHAARRSGYKDELFGYVPGGYARILDRLCEEVLASGAKLIPGRPARRVAGTAGGRVGIELSDGEHGTFDKVILTVPSSRAASLCPELTESERAALSSVEYQGIVCASVVLRRPFGAFYVTNLTDTTLPFTGVIEMTHLVDREQLSGNSLVYLPLYLNADDPRWSDSDADLRERFTEGLTRIQPAFDEKDVLAFQISRAREVFAVPTPNYSRRLAPPRTSVPGLFVVNSSQIVNGTLNVNETVHLADSSAAWLASDSATGREENPWSTWWCSQPKLDPKACVFEASLLHDELRKLVNPRASERVLDIGCGAGFFAEQIAPHVESYEGLDIATDALDAARLRLGGRSNCRFHGLDPNDSTNLRAVSGRDFTLIVCSSVIQYFNDRHDVVQLIRNVRGVAAPGARMLIADIPTGSGALREATSMLWFGLRRGALRPVAGALLCSLARDYRTTRRQARLLDFSPQALHTLLEDAGVRGEVVPVPLTPRTGRLHLLVHFPTETRDGTHGECS